MCPLSSDSLQFKWRPQPEEADRNESCVSEQTELSYCNWDITDGSLEQSSLAGPLHISCPIKAPPAHAFQLPGEIYCLRAGLIQQDTEGT